MFKKLKSKSQAILSYKSGFLRNCAQILGPILLLLTALQASSVANAQDVIPKITSFTASPSTAVPPNTTVRLSWVVNTGFPKLCVNNPPLATVTPIDVSNCWINAIALTGVSGFRDVVVSQTTQYVLALPTDGGAGSFDFKALTVEVSNDAPPVSSDPQIINFQPTQPEVEAGKATGDFKLVWTTRNAQGTQSKLIYTVVNAETNGALPCLDGSPAPCNLDISQLNCTDSCEYDISQFADARQLDEEQVGKIFTFTLSLEKPSTPTVTANTTLRVNATASPGTSSDPDPSGAAVGTVLNVIAQIVGAIIQLLTTILYWIFSFIVAPLIEAILAIRPYKDQFVQVIYPGWLILRNLSNIFFIVVLLVIGLATLFQVEKYNYKHLLVKVVIAAVLVNFSLVIGQSILGIADTVQNQFLPNRVNVIRALGIELMVKPVEQIQTKDDSVAGGLSNITYPFFLFWLSLAAFFTFIAILAFLLVRIVGLWILLMVAPVAFVANVLPETEKYAKEWWSKFLMYAFITPILGFFLNIAALFANSHVFSQGSPIFSTSSVSGTISDFVYLTAGHVTVIAFLLAGIKFASSSGVIGAKAIIGLAEKGINAPFKLGAGVGLLAGKGAKALAERGLDEASWRTGVQLDPRQWIKQWEEYSHHKKEERLQRLEGLGNTFSKPMDFFNAYINIPGAQRLLAVAQHGTAKQVAEELKDAEEHSKEANDVLTAEGRKKVEDEIKALEAQKVNVSNAVVGKAQAKDMLDKTKDAITELDDEIKELRGSGQTKEADDKSDILTQLKEFKLDLDRQIKSESNGNTVTLGKGMKMSGETADLIKNKIFDADKVEKDIQRQIDEVNQKLKNDEHARIKLNIDPQMSDEAIKKMQEDAEHHVHDLQHTLDHVRRPEFVYARLARTAAESDQQKKLAGIDDAEELKRLLQNAIHEGNVGLAGAVIKKLAQDSNFNEVLEGKDKHGNKITASADGMKLFFEDLREKMGMSKSQMFQMASEVSYINEGNNWWDLARTTTITPTGMAWLDNDDHQRQIFGEMGKRNYRSQASNFSRLSFVTQQRAANGGWQSTGLTKAGIAILQQASRNSGAITEFQRNLRANTAAAISMIDNWKSKLRSNGVHENMIKVIENASGKHDGKVTLEDPYFVFGGKAGQIE